MTYRDDLAAAHARIEALEQELRARGNVDEEVTAQVKRLGEQLTAAQSKAEIVAAERDRFRAAVAQLEDRVAGLSPSSGSSSLYVLSEHNRRFRPIAQGTPGGVACPLCHADGLEVEMRHRTGLALQVRATAPEPAFTYVDVTCPRCLYSSFKRMS